MTEINKQVGKYADRMKRKFVRLFKCHNDRKPNDLEVECFVDGFRAGHHGGYVKARLELGLPVGPERICERLD